MKTFIYYAEVETPKRLREFVNTTKEDEVAPCGIDCGKCLRYEQRKCLACPATKYYRGPL
jgi:hypothetical protein